MSYAGFQRALSALVGSPELAVDVRAGRLDILERHDLDTRERDRLVSMCLHPGMSVNCTLVRTNRLIPLLLSMPTVCEVLGEQRRAVLDRYWADGGERSVHYRREAEHFAAFLRAELAAGRLDVPGLEKALAADGC